jgi:hypothetical protein
MMLVDGKFQSSRRVFRLSCEVLGSMAQLGRARNSILVTETLTIKGFCGLTSVELNFAPVTLFIGPQASGKSVIAKAMFYFRRIPAQLLGAAEEGKSVDQLPQICAKEFCRMFTPVNWRGSAFSMEYKSGSGTVSIDYAGEQITPDGSGLAVRLSEAYEAVFTRCSNRRREVLAALSEQQPDSAEEGWKNDRLIFEGEFVEKLGAWANFAQMFIPAGRAFFAQVKSSVFTTLAEGGEIDPFLVYFGRLLEQSERILEAQGLYYSEPKAVKRWEVFRSSFAAILGAQLAKHDGHNCLVTPDGRRVRLGQASSGQQEVFPLMMLFGRFFALPHRHGRAVYVEEPEAHLFPSTQREIVGLLTRTFRKRSEEMRLIVTTHSPYVLTAFNNFLQAGAHYAKADAEERNRLGKIIPEKLTLRENELVAYALEGGQAKQIMNPETGLIDAGIIDAVSTDLSLEFDRLLWEGK